MSLAIVWFRRDLRLADNPALAAALANHERVLPLYIHAPDEESPWAPGAASRWWLHHALSDLAQQLGGRLLIRHGPSLDTLEALLAHSGAQAVYWNRLYEPAAIARDSAVKKALRAAGVRAESANAALLFEPWEIANRQGSPFKVFTPFWRRLNEAGLPRAAVEVPAPAARRLAQPRLLEGLGGAALDELGLLPELDWDAGIAAAWQPSRAAAEARLEEFLASGVRRYAQGRDRPAANDVSRLSPYLHFGQLGPREVAAACRAVRHDTADFMRELGWREFAHHLLYHFPHTTDAPMDGRFAAFPWRDDMAQLAAWQQGRTGIPLVDAGMRQLWDSGWMHNRVRMVVASFLTKNLLHAWQQGAAWFWDTLVDADLASNSLGWQWTAGCGADAAPFFRVFNPVLQGEKFDPDGAYVRRWVPELAELPAKWVHRPWEAPDQVLVEAGVALDQTYPRPIVDLKATRRRALEAWGTIK
jgi:deoxyribodipyrimidine photo-lyase